MKNKAAAARKERADAYERLLQQSQQPYAKTVKPHTHRLRVKRMVPPVELHVKVAPA